MTGAQSQDRGGFSYPLCLERITPQRDDLKRFLLSSMVLRVTGPRGQFVGEVSWGQVTRPLERGSAAAQLAWVPKTALSHGWKSTPGQLGGGVDRSTDTWPLHVAWASRCGLWV